MICKIEKIITKSLLSLMAMIFVSSILAPVAVAVDPVTDAVIVNDGEYYESDAAHNADGSHDGAHKDAHHAEIEGLPQLDFTTYTPQLFWMFAVFALLYIVFAKKALPDISSTIENRKNHIQSDLEAAEKLTAEADSVHDAYQENLTASQAAASETIQKMEGKMKAKADKAMDDFRVRSEDEINSAEDRIIAAKQAAMGDMNKIVTEVTSEAVEKILGQSPDLSAVKNTVETLNATPAKAKAA